MMVAGMPAAVGLHYGGSRSEPPENWGHRLGAVLDAVGTPAGKTLGEVLKSHGVKLVNRPN